MLFNILFVYFIVFICFFKRNFLASRRLFCKLFQWKFSKSWEKWWIKFLKKYFKKLYEMKEKCCYPCQPQESLNSVLIHFSWCSNITIWKWSEVKVVQLCPTLCNPMDCTIHGILQARILEWVAFTFFRGSSQPRDWSQVSHIAGRFLYQLSHKTSPRILEWVAYPFSRASSRPRTPTGVLHSRWILYQLSYQGSPGKRGGGETK